MDLRIGQGFDIHALVPGRPLILGGVTIPHEKGLAGHSDADCLLHAIIDALLGAAGMGDIGGSFPDSDARWHGADSRTLLRSVFRRVLDAGWCIVNLDSTIIAQTPRMAPHIGAMRSNLAQDLALPPERVNIKAKTMERLGAIGRGEGIAAEAVVLLYRG